MGQWVIHWTGVLELPGSTLNPTKARMEQQVCALVSARLLPEGRRHDGLLSRGEPLRQLPSAVPMLGLPTHRATTSSWIVPLHRAASRGSSTQHGVQLADPVLLVALAGGVAQAPCARPVSAVGRRHCHQNRGAAFGTGDVLRFRSDRVDDIGVIRRLGAGVRRHAQQLGHAILKRLIARWAGATAHPVALVERLAERGVVSGSQGTRRTPWTAA